MTTRCPEGHTPAKDWLSPILHFVSSDETCTSRYVAQVVGLDPDATNVILSHDGYTLIPIYEAWQIVCEWGPKDIGETVLEDEP